MSEQHVPEFEDRVRTLLARTAEAIPADTDRSAQMLQALTRDSRGASARGGRREVGIVGARPVLAIVAAVVVVALLAGVLTFVRPRGSLLPPAGGVTGAPTTTATTATTTATAAPFPQVVPLVPPACRHMGPANTPPSSPVDHAVVIDRHASVNGITITIDRAYADATQTVITYHMQTNHNPPLPAQPVLIDAQGHRYAAIGDSWGIQEGGHVIFTPLPPEELGTPQALTFFTQQMANSAGSGALVDGPWQIPFSLTPAAGTSLVLHNAPLMHNRLSVQPLRLDVAPPGGGLDGATGGTRVVVRLSGLAPGMRLVDGLNFVSSYYLGGGATSCGGGILELVLPNGQQIVPGVAHLLGQTVPATSVEDQAASAQTVGPSGTVDLEALFYTPIPAGTSVTLFVDHVPAQLAGAATLTQINGPWEFWLLPPA